MPKMNGSVFGPTGRMRATRSVGTNAPSSTVDWLWVARMPRVSQSSRLAIQGFTGDETVDELVAVPAEHPEPGPRRASDVKIFVPVNAQPSPTGSAVVSESHSTRSLPGSLLPNANSSPAAASSSTQSSDVVAALGEHSRDPDPDEVHVDAERGRRGVRGEQSLVARGLEQRRGAR